MQITRRPAWPGLAFSAILAAFGAVSASQAQTPAPPAAAASATVLAPVPVTGQREAESATGPVLGYTARRSATATKTDTPLNEVPQSISVITADQLRDQASHTMQEALRYSAGVRTETYGVDNRGDWFLLRGGSEGSVLLDGLRLPLSGFWGVVRNEPYAFERIEVLRGPASVIAGQNGPGGVVNLVSKRPLAEPMRELNVQVGTDSHRQLSADLTGPLNDDGSLLYRVVALGKDSGTQVQHAFDDRSFFAPSLTWQPLAGTRLTVFAEYQRDESGNLNAFFPLEGTLLPAPNGPIPYDTFIGEPDWDTYGGTRHRLGYQLAQRLGEQWTLRHHLRHDRVEGKMRTMYAAWYDGWRNAAGEADPNGTYLNREWYFYDDRNHITNADLLLEGRLNLGRAQHTLLFGIDAMRSRSHYDSWSGQATPLDVYNPVYGSFPLPELGASIPGSDRLRRVGVLAQDQIKFDDRWVFVAGVRHDKADNGGKKDSATTGNLGAVFLAPGGWSPYVSVSQSFEPVAGADVAGEPFKPLRGRQVEAGVKWQPQDERITAGAAVYQLVEKNRLATDPENVNEQVQRGEVTVKGLELEVSAAVDAWDLLGQYTYTDARTTRTTAEDLAYLDQPVSSVPKHAAAVWALHRFGAWGLPGLRAGLGVRYVGEVTDGTGANEVPSVTLVDAMLGYDIGAWQLALNVNNLADKTYVAACLERGDCWFGAKRRAVLSATFRW